MKKLLFLLLTACTMIPVAAAWKAQNAGMSEDGGVVTVKSAAHNGGVADVFKVEPRRRYVISGEVRGEGKIQMAVFGSPAATLSPVAVLEKDQWQKLELGYFSPGEQISLKIYSLEPSPAEFQVRNFTVAAQEKLKLEDREIPRLDYEARNYPGNGRPVKLADAFNGQAVWGKRWYRPVTGIPVPLNSRPLHFRARFRKNSDAKVTVRVLNGAQTVASGAFSGKDRWEWVVFSPLDAEAAYPEVSFVYDCDADTQIWLDRIAVGTDPGFDPDAAVVEDPGLSMAAVGRNGSVKIGPFVLRGENRFAQEQTELTFRYDDEKFYAVFTCAESCLEPVNNRLHEFQSTVAGPDNSKIYGDDCVVLLLQPPGSPNAYEFTANANGALLDARCPEADLWGGRDLEWNSGAAVSARKGDGAWTVEMAVPFRSMGVSVPKPGERWKIMAGRIERSRNEVSAWQTVGKGFHQAADFGEVLFMEQVPDVGLAQMPGFASGKNRIDVTADRPVEVESVVRFAGRPPQYFRGGDFMLAQSGTFDYRWSVRDPADLTVYYRSPVYTLGVRGTTLKFDAANRVKVNGVDEKSGSAALSDGLNVIETASPFNGEFKAGELRFAPPRGKFTLMVNESTVWPNWQIDGISVNRGGLQQLLFQVQGVEGYTLNDYTLYLDLPPGFIFEGASGYYRKWKLETGEVGTVKFGEAEYRRYRVRFSSPVSSDKKQPHHHYIAVLFRAPETGNAELPLYFHAGSEEHGIIELPRKLDVRLLPPLSGRRPQTLLVQMWTSWMHNLDDENVYGKFRDHFIAMGVNETQARFDGIRNLALVNFEPWNLGLSEYIRRNPEAALVDRHGKRSSDYICTSVMLQDGAFKVFFQERMAEWLAKRNYPAHVDWDYESPVMGSYISCFCPRCLSEFGQGDPEKHMAGWTAFMNRRMAGVAALLNDAVKRAKPGTLFSVYSGYQSEDTRRHYGVDWSALAGKIDLAMCGYGRPVRELEGTREVLGKTPLTIGAIAYSYVISERYAPRPVTGTTLLRCAADANYGILVYWYPSLDGRSFEAIGEVSAIMAEYEPFFLRGERLGDQLNLPGWSRADYEMLAGASGERLVLLMNTGNRERDYQFEWDGQRRSGKVEAGGVKALLLKK
jgi:hypothetical protein